LEDTEAYTRIRYAEKTLPKAALEVGSNDKLIIIVSLLLPLKVFCGEKQFCRPDKNFLQNRAWGRWQ